MDVSASNAGPTAANPFGFLYDYGISFTPSVGKIVVPLLYDDDDDSMDLDRDSDVEYYDEDNYANTFISVNPSEWTDEAEHTIHRSLRAHCLGFRGSGEDFFNRINDVLRSYRVDISEFLLFYELRLKNSQEPCLSQTSRIFFEIWLSDRSVRLFGIDGETFKLPDKATSEFLRRQIASCFRRTYRFRRIKLPRVSEMNEMIEKKCQSLGISREILYERVVRTNMTNRVTQTRVKEWLEKKQSFSMQRFCTNTTRLGSKSRWTENERLLFVNAFNEIGTVDVDRALMMCNSSRSSCSVDTYFWKHLRHHKNLDRAVLENYTKTASSQSHIGYTRWKKGEDELLLSAMELYGTDFEKIESLKLVPGRTHNAMCKRYENFLKDKIGEEAGIVMQVRKVIQFSVPCSKRELRAFLAMTNPLRELVQNYSGKTRLLRPLTGRKLAWPEDGLSQAQIKAFQTLKTSLRDACMKFNVDL
eukprot:g1303.t1